MNGGQVVYGLPQFKSKLRKSSNPVVKKWINIRVAAVSGRAAEAKLARAASTGQRQVQACTNRGSSVHSGGRATMTAQSQTIEEEPQQDDYEEDEI
ncbi:hypothetical protein RRF57_008367 [Xylaria bambusicola]|uniref:Uncharacterized protein n=1 Tax=Xylaria bambusicola TaxID=326684 RepID=A0AAN7UMW8_9PEZI